MAARGERGTVLVEVWSDVVCPWCYIGKRHLEAAIDAFRLRDEVSVVWRSYELDPDGPPRRHQSMAEVIAHKYGMTADQATAANARLTRLAAEVGLDYHLDDVVMGNTFDAHRLIHLAASVGRADPMGERLMAAYFTEGVAIGERDSLIAQAEQVGLDRDQVAAVLDGDGCADAVRADQRAAAELGVTGVPFFAIGGRLGVSGAQPPEVLLRALERAAGG